MAHSTSDRKHILWFFQFYVKWIKCIKRFFFWNASGDKRRLWQTKQFRHIYNYTCRYFVLQSLEVLVVFEISMSLAFCRGAGNCRQEINFEHMKKWKNTSRHYHFLPFLKNFMEIYAAISEKSCGQKREQKPRIKHYISITEDLNNNK